MIPLDSMKEYGSLEKVMEKSRKSLEFEIGESGNRCMVTFNLVGNVLIFSGMS